MWEEHVSSSFVAKKISIQNGENRRDTVETLNF